MVISWKNSNKQILDANPELLDPTKSAPLAVMVGVRSRDGEATVKLQLHRARAYFDAWLAAYLDYVGNFKKLHWGM